MDGNGVGYYLQQRQKKLSHLWSIVEKLPNNDHETSLTIIVLRGPFKRKYGSEDVKSNFSPVLPKLNGGTQNDIASFTWDAFVNQVFDGG